MYSYLLWRFERSKCPTSFVYGDSAVISVIKIKSIPHNQVQLKYNSIVSSDLHERFGLILSIPIASYYFRPRITWMNIRGRIIKMA